MADDFVSLSYEIGAVLFLFIIFYLTLSSLAIFRLKELSSITDKYIMAICFYLLILVLCLFRISTLAYLVYFVSKHNDNIDQLKDYAENFSIGFFFIIFPDFIFWPGMGCFFWIVITFFYSSHITSEDLSHLNPALHRFKIRLRSQLFFWIFNLIYVVIQIAIIGNYFSNNNVTPRVYASVQAGCSFIIPLIIFYFIQRMYKTFSGVFYVNEEQKKVSRMGVKTMGIILAIRFFTGLVDLGLLQSDEVRSFLNITQDNFNYSHSMIGLALVAVSFFFLEILPIYYGFQQSMVKLCFQLTKDGRIRDSPGLKNEKAPLIEQNRTSLEKGVVLNIRQETGEDQIFMSERIVTNLKIFDFNDLTFEEELAPGRKNKFGTIQLANSSSLYESLGNGNSYLLCVRTVEIPAMNRFLLEDVERDMNKHIFIQSELPNKIVNLLGYCVNNENIYFIYENMRNGSLKALLENPQKEALSFDIRKKMLVDLAKVIGELHSFNIVHGHLSPSNIFFDSDFNVRIGDILLYDLKKYTGYSKGYSNKSKYTAPEHLKENGFISVNPTTAADSYSFAILAWEVLTGEEAFRGINKTELKRILIEENSRPKIPEKIDPEIAKLIRCCWQTESNKRPSFPQIIQIFQDFAQK